MRYPRIATLLFFSCAGAFLSGCHNEDADPIEPQAILTLQVDAGYGVGNDKWVFASDENGEVLDVQPYEDGQTVTLMSDKHPAKINVTLFEYGPLASVNTLLAFRSWGDVASGTTFHLKAPKSPTNNPERANASLNITNFNITMSQLGLSYGLGIVGYSGTLALGHLEMDLSYFGAPSDILLYAWQSGVPKYYMAPAVKANDQIDLDFMTDFTPFPHPFKLDFAGSNSAVIEGYDAKKSQTITLLDTYYNYGNTGSDHPVIGYLDGYDSYNMRVSNYQANGYNTTYHKKGAINFSFDMPAYTFSVTDRSVKNFTYTFSHHYTFSGAFWQHIDDKEYTWWTVYAPSGYTAKGLSIPSQILAKYPQLDVNKLEFGYMSFYDNIKGRSYVETFPGATIATSEDTAEDYTYTVK
ncbi:MAG TPA: hypothetical protein VIU12_02075 [Chryseolinea sp.]